MKSIWESKKLAIAVSYITVFANSLSSIILTRVYLNKLGVDTYGLYQMVYSVAHYILILDLGISTTMIRYITEFDTLKDYKKKENFAFHFLLIVIGLSIVVGIVGAIVNANLENIYRSLTPEEYVLSHRMFIVMVLQIVLTIFSHYLSGILLANEKYAFSKGLALFETFLNLVLVIVLLELGFGVMSIVYTKTALILFRFVVIFYYDFIILKFRIKFYCWNFAILRPAFLLMLAMLLQSVVGHVNSSVDKTILGIMATKADVAVYAIAATFITMFNTLPTSISSVFQTKATRIVMLGAGHRELEDFVIRPGRIQFMVCGGIFAGFTLFGQDFIICWAGENMVGAWKYAMVIMLPNMIPLVQNVCLSILNALDKRIFRSMILAAITVLNIILTVLLIRLIGPFGAPLATAISYIIGHDIIMNVYYQKKIHLDVKRMFREIFSKIWICVIAAGIVNVPLIFWKDSGNWLVFITKGVVFSAVYTVLLWKYGMNDAERKMFSGIGKKLLRSRHA